MDEEHSVKELISALGKTAWEDYGFPNVEHQRIVTQLGQMGEAAVELLIIALSNENALIRYGAIESLLRLKIRQPIDKMITILSDDEDARVRSMAAAWLGQFGDERAVIPLTIAVEDENERVAGWAATSLGLLAGEKAVETLIKALNNPATRRDAAEMLGHIGDERAIKPLIASLYANADEIYASELEIEDEEDTKHYIRADFFSRSHVRALAAIGGTGTIAPLIEALTSGDVKVFDPAFYGLKMIGSPAVKPLIAKLPNEIRYKDRLIWLLGEIGDSRAFEAVFAELDDEEPLVRQAAISALGDLKDKRAVPRLIEIAQSSDDEWMRRGAIESLAQIESAGNVEILISALQDESQLVQVSAAEALAEIGDTRAKEKLIEISKIENLWVAQIAVSALHKLGYDIVPPEQNIGNIPF